MSSLKSDELLIDRVNSPFAFMPFHSSPAAMAEEKLWTLHYKFYVLLDELQEIYTFAKTYGNGRFGILFKRHRPEIWAVLPLQAAFPGLISITAVDYRKAFHTTLLQTLRMDPLRDADLSHRLQKAIKKLTDEETRLFNDYLETFSALYPSDPTARVIAAFIETGSKNQFGTGLKDFLQPVFTAPTFAEINISAAPVEPDDPLAELEKLTGNAESSAGGQNESAISADADEGDDSASEERTTTPTALEPPPPGTEDLFKIWD